MNTAIPAATAATGSTNSPSADQFKTGKIVMIDDEPVNIKVVQKYLKVAGYTNFASTTESAESIGFIDRERPDIILLDIVMPGVGGLDILQTLRADARLRHIPVIILTASTDSAVKLRALELGATDFLAKPVDAQELVPRIRNAMLVKIHQDHLANYSQELEKQVRLRTVELELSRLQVIQCLARAAEYRDDDTGQHVIRVGRCAGIIARQLGFPEKDAAMLELAAQLHDMGKIGIPDAILLKPGKLNPDELENIKRHCKIGMGIVMPALDTPAEFASRYLGIHIPPEVLTPSPLLAMAGRIAITHHERWDGGGYPSGLKGEQIPIEGRITAASDVFDALRSVRPYKPAYPIEKCVAIMREGRGSQFDPNVLDALLLRLAEIVEVYAQYAEAA
jgi:putative two-component system response regulator